MIHHTMVMFYHITQPIMSRIETIQVEEHIIASAAQKIRKSWQQELAINLTQKKHSWRTSTATITDMETANYQVQSQDSVEISSEVVGNETTISYTGSHSHLGKHNHWYTLSEADETVIDVQKKQSEQIVHILGYLDNENNVIFQWFNSDAEKIDFSMDNTTWEHIVVNQRVGAEVSEDTMLDLVGF